MKVFVYYNLHKHLWSVRAMEGVNKGKVIAHEDSLELINCTFKVSQAGRNRVLKEKKKNVHAGVVGYWNRNDGVKSNIKEMDLVRYNPYLFDSFIRINDHSNIYHASAVVLTRFREVYAHAIEF